MVAYLALLQERRPHSFSVLMPRLLFCINDLIFSLSHQLLSLLFQQICLCSRCFYCKLYVMNGDAIGSDIAMGVPDIFGVIALIFG